MSDEYWNAHGCKVVTGDEDSNLLFDKICEGIDMSIEGDNLQDGQNYGQELHECTTTANGKNQFDMIFYYYIVYFNM